MLLLSCCAATVALLPACMAAGATRSLLEARHHSFNPRCICEVSAHQKCAFYWEDVHQRNFIEGPGVQAEGPADVAELEGAPADLQKRGFKMLFYDALDSSR